MIFNTINSIASQGMDAIEALNNTPLIKVQNDKISIVGKSNITIMINERILNVQGDALTNYLKALRSDDIEKIEVITNPPSKYDASGNGGIVNIVLKKNNQSGLYGAVGGAYSYNNYNAGSGNANINYQTAKWNIMLKANHSKGNYASNNNYSYANNEVFLKSNSNPIGKDNSGGINLTTNYHLSSKDLLGVVYNLSKYNSTVKNKNTFIYHSLPSQIVDSTINSSIQTKDKNLYQTVNLFYDKNLDTIGSKLSIGVNYFSNTPIGSTDFNDYNEQSRIKNSTSFTNDQNYQVWSGTADMLYKLSFLDIELGAKYTNYNNKSDALYYNNSNGIHTYDITKSNHFNYKEDNIAGYISFNKKLKDKWDIKTGLRFEQTEKNGHLIETDENFKKSYGKWFPSIYVSYNYNDNHPFNFNYSKRIQRPNSNILNPFKTYENTYSYHSGNPQLNPSYINNFELNYLFNNAFSFGITYYHVSDSFDQYTVFKDNIFASTYYNMLNSDNYGANVSYNEKIMGWWQTNTGTNAYYTNSYFKSHLATQIAQNGVTFSYYSQNTFTINKTKTLNIFINWHHQLPNKEDNTKYSAYKTLSTGLKANLLENKLNLNFTISDLFNTAKSKGTIYYFDNIQTYHNTWNSRKAVISISYSFGDTTNKKEIKEATFEDKDRSSK